MTNEEIFKKAIEKARKNGFDDFFWVEGNASTYPIKDFINKKNLSWLTAIIFSHDFARAFWGLGDFTNPKGKGYIGAKGPVRDFKYHLQQMVLEEEPLLYLKKFL